MRPMAEYLAEHTNWRLKGILLPGHGTTVDDMQKSGGSDWIAAAEKAYDDLEGECRHVFLAGVSLGATICCQAYPPVAHAFVPFCDI